MKNLYLTEGIELERDLNDAYLEKLSRLGHRVSFESSQYLFHQGEHAGFVYILKEGSLKTTRSDEKGNDTRLKIHQPGALIGLSTLRPSPTRDANCIAVEKSTATQFSRNEFFNLMLNDGELGILLVQLLLKRQQFLHTRVSDATGLSVEQRLARALVQMHMELVANGGGADQPSIRISHAELAALVFSRRQYITAILRKFSINGLIKNKRQQIFILDIERLVEVITG